MKASSRTLLWPFIFPMWLMKAINRVSIHCYVYSYQEKKNESYPLGGKSFRYCFESRTMLKIMDSFIAGKLNPSKSPNSETNFRSL